MSDNPFLKIENPYDANGAQVKKAQEYEQEFERLCWSIWHHNEDGKKLYELLTDRYLKQNQINPMSPTAPNEALWWDGFKACMIGLHALGKKHILRVNAGVGNE